MSALAKEVLSAALVGLLFGLGIVISGMGNPAKVLAFFDFAGHWDPSLAFVMAGAVTVAAIGYRLVFKRAAPVLAPRFHVPTGKEIDAPLIFGSAVFGIAWGLTGFCPGGVVPMLGLGRYEPVLFFLAFLTGIFATRQLRSALARARPTSCATSN